jgi:hypothetical protein
MRALLVPILAFLIALASSCGGGSPRMLVSIKVTPSNANGQAQFTALGTFSDGTQSQIEALWTLTPPFSLTPNMPTPGGINLSSTGLAQCTGFTGITGIWATAPTDPNTPLSKMTMSTPSVSGTAHFVCP